MAERPLILSPSVVSTFWATKFLRLCNECHFGQRASFFLSLEFWMTWKSECVRLAYASDLASAHPLRGREREDKRGIKPLGNSKSAFRVYTSLTQERERERERRKGKREVDGRRERENLPKRNGWRWLMNLPPSRTRAPTSSSQPSGFPITRSLDAFPLLSLSKHSVQAKQRQKE